MSHLLLIIADVCDAYLNESYGKSWTKLDDTTTKPSRFIQKDKAMVKMNSSALL